MATGPTGTVGRPTGFDIENNLFADGQGDHLLADGSECGGDLVPAESN